MTDVVLADGRTLEVTISGPAEGVPLVFHHGTPGSSAPMSATLQAANHRGLRLVTWSRPGYGGSTRSPGRRVADVAADTGAVLDHLDAERCLVAGWSGGGPHALACGALLPDRVLGVLSIAGIAPYDGLGGLEGPGGPEGPVGPVGLEGLDWSDWTAGMGEANLEEFGNAARGESALRPYLDAARGELAQVTGEEIGRSLATLLPRVDLDALTSEFADDLATSFRGAVVNGIEGWLDDDLAFLRPWGFELADVTVPTFLWQGFEDRMVPVAHGQWLAQHLPGSTAHLEPGQGHLSIILGMGRMLDGLTALLD